MTINQDIAISKKLNKISVQLLKMISRKMSEKVKDKIRDARVDIEEARYRILEKD